MRIIGCGNSDRGDDGAGILVARRLRELGFDAIEHSGDGLALIELWHGSDDVILVDAVQSGGEPGAVTVWDPVSQALPTQECRSSTHVLGPAEAIEIGRAVGRLPERIRIYGIEAASFEPGAQPSEAVLVAVDAVVRELAQAAGIHRAQVSTGTAMSGVG